MTVARITKTFAKYGFTETPLTIAQIEQCLAWNFDEEEIFQLGSDLAAGFEWKEVIHLYQKESA